MMRANVLRPCVWLAAVLAVLAGSAGSARAQTVEVVRSFASAPHGLNPLASLVRGPDGYFYGTTPDGGAHGFGTIFRIDAAGTVTAVHSFSGTDGARPLSALVESSGGLWGTTYDGGENDFGTIFRWAGNELTTSYHFRNEEDGGAPWGGLILADGELVGTTSTGGEEGCGTIFAFDQENVTTLHSFNGIDGCGPVSSLLSANGLLYGTTPSDNVVGAGTVFAFDRELGELTTIHQFALTDGYYPYGGLLQVPDGRIIGTTYFGGDNGLGTIFQLTGLGPVTTLHHFVTGRGPLGTLILASDDRLLGTTASGGAFGLGTIFQVAITTDAVSVIHNFNGTNGESPFAGLIKTPDGDFLGTTQMGGSLGGGTAFRLTAGGALTTLFNFGTRDGVEPFAGLIEAADGNFYGTTYNGGSGGRGTVFKVDAAGLLTTVHSFDGTTGGYPQSALIQGLDGNLYGTTPDGGASGQGTIFRINSAGTFTTIHSFGGAISGTLAGLVQGSDGRLYGTSPAGGTSGVGTVFRIDTDGGNPTTLHSFTSVDGQLPMASLMRADDGRLYGTTTEGGANGKGTIFQVDLAGAVTTIHHFTTAEGFNVLAPLVQAADGLFYGTAMEGGAFNGGTVFRTDPSGAVTVLHSFSFSEGGSPYGGLLQASDGNFYGALVNGGTYGYGSVFRMDALGGFSVFHHFFGTNGAEPRGTLIQASNGYLYGTTSAGGSSSEETLSTNAGVIFRFALLPTSSTSLNSSPNPSVIGQTVTLTATVSGSGTPTGTVEFFNGTTSLGGASLSGGTATKTVSDLAVGSHQLRARYVGSSAFGPSVSTAVTHVVSNATFTLSVAVAGAGTGTVTSPDGLINCPGDCTEDYSTGTVVELTATPAAGSVLTGWSGACTGTAACSVTMNAAASVTATFGISGADLRETALSNPPASVVPGGRFTLTDTVTNNGTVTAAASTTQYYLSADTAKDVADVLIGARALLSLAGGASSTGSKTVTVPAGIVYGTYYVVACADDRFRVAETNEANNCLAAATTVVVGRPDLAVTALSNPPTEVAAGRTFGITDTVTNIGTAAAGASTVRYYLSADAIKGAGDVLLTPTRAVVSLAPGAASSGPRTLTVPATTPAGIYRVLACADDLLRVVELDEANNCTASAGTVEVKYPDLVQLTITDPPASTIPGGRFTVADSVRNQGTIAAVASATRYYFSLDAVKDAGDLLLTGTRSVPLLAPGATSGGSRTLTVPSTMPAGTYYLLACADATAKNIESDETNNCLASSTTTVVVR